MARKTGIVATRKIEIQFTYKSCQEYSLLSLQKCLCVYGKVSKPDFEQQELIYKL